MVMMFIITSTSSMPIISSDPVIAIGQRASTVASTRMAAPPRAFGGAR